MVAGTTYRMTMEKPMSGHFGLCDQIRRAAVSIPANLAEGYALGTRPQLIRCLRIALGSTAELWSHVGLAGELALIPSEMARQRKADCERLISLLVGLLKRLGARVPAKHTT
jgi:four helix bundle protein